MADRCPITYLTNRGYKVRCLSLAGHYGRHDYDIPWNAECLHPYRDKLGRCYGCETPAAMAASSANGDDDATT